MTDPSFYAPLARAAEEAGFASMMVPDSICYPEHSDSRYPFNPDGSREFLEDKPFLEPFSLIPALGAVTRQLRFITCVLKLPVRHPVLAASRPPRPPCSPATGSSWASGPARGARTTTYSGSTGPPAASAW